METVSFLSDAFTLFLHLPKKKAASGGRDGWYPGLITDSTFKSAKSCRTYQSAHVFPGVEVWQLRIDPDVNC